jgi:hypothetical protein
VFLMIALPELTGGAPGACRAAQMLVPAPL